jgi:hypothetical protein
MSTPKSAKNISASKAISLPPDSTSRLRAIVRWGIFAIVITVAAVVRFVASLDNLWLDEIWSWMIAVRLTSPLEVITRVHHDNNHYLNTLVMYACGGDASMSLYRLPAVVAGIGTVLLAGTVAKQWSAVAAMTATLITGCSFLLIQYSSEARGYAYLLFFTTASFAVMQQSLNQPRAVGEILFAIFTVLGFLSHPTYSFAFVALVSWSAWHRIATDGWLSRRHIVPLIFEVLIPGIFLFVLYIVDWRYLAIGGGDEGSAWRVFAQATSAAFGGPIEGPAVVLVAAAVFAIAMAAMYELYRTGSDLWVPMIVGIFAMPACILLVVQPESPYPRYFLISALFLQLLMSWYLGRIFERSNGKMAYLFIMAVILGGNCYLTGRLLSSGRGGYEAAVNYLLLNSSRPRVVIASDHDFRNQIVLEYYFWRVGAADRWSYVESGRWPLEGPEWILLHDFNQDSSPPESIRIPPGYAFQREQIYPYFGLSGCNWALYRNAKH